jgi:hypothetical protein
LVLDALREHLRRLEFWVLEERDRQGYLKNPDVGEGGKWEAEAAWPVLVLTRDAAIGYLSTVTIAPITSTVRGVL